MIGTPGALPLFRLHFHRGCISLSSVHFFLVRAHQVYLLQTLFRIAYPIYHRTISTLMDNLGVFA